MYYKPEELQDSFWPSFISKYPLLQKSAQSGLVPITLGNLSDMVAAGDENGIIYIWNDVEAIRENINSNYLTHCSNVSRVQLTADDSKLISLGEFDSTMC